MKWWHWLVAALGAVAAFFLGRRQSPAAPPPNDAAEKAERIRRQADKDRREREAESKRRIAEILKAGEETKDADPVDRANARLARHKREG